MNRPIIALTCLAVSAATTSFANAAPLLDQMRSLSKEGALYAYEMKVVEDGFTATGKIDPSQPEGNRITVYTPSEENWPDGFADDLSQMEAETDGDIWCQDLGDMVPENAKLISETDSSATFGFVPVPDADADKDEAKMMKKLTAEITLDKADGAILSYKMWAEKPFKPAMVVKINQFQMDATCARAPDGRTYISEFQIDLSGSAMMQSFEQSEYRQITTLLQPVS